LNSRNQLNQHLLKEASFQDKKVTYKLRSKFARFYKDNKDVDMYFDKKLEIFQGSILILGTGDSDITKFLKGKITQITGIDISQESVKKVNDIIKKKKKEKKIKEFLMDAHNLKFPDNYFDGVIGSAILHHLDIKKALPEISRVLKKDGNVLFLEPLGLNPIINFFRKLTPNMRTISEHALTFKDIKQINKYFKINLKGFYFITILSFVFNLINSKYLYRTSRNIFDKIDNNLLNIIPFLKYFCWIIIIEGKKN